MSVYLGLDASTQSLTALLIDVSDNRREIVLELSFTYDKELPGYGTEHGVLRVDDPTVVVSPPLMWVEALDRMMARLVDERPREMASLSAISGSAQQHGSVYLNERGLASVTRLEPATPLAEQLRDAFARQLSPVWMDSSTTTECMEIEQAVGGADALARETGSRAFERFTGPQIRAFSKRHPQMYAETSRVHLVSSFHASLLAGADAAVDHGDGSGMNLMALTKKAWWPAALEATAPHLERRLPRLAPSWTVVGTLASYWRRRYNLPAANVIAWSGDNPCSVIGSGLVRPGRLAISLGTSDTVCGLMRDPDVDRTGAGYISASPTGEYMGTTVFKNGSLARERVRDMFGMDWAKFSAALAATPPGNRGAIMLPWFDPEITPHVIRPGVRRVNLSADDAPANVRAIVEAQMMAMANHTRWMGGDTSVIYATGGAAGNPAVLQVMADVFGARVIRSRTRNAAALGAALRAWHADRLATGRPIAWDDTVESFGQLDPAWRFEPRADAAQVYAELKRQYALAEAQAVTRR
jgi:xylulokinase